MSSSSCVAFVLALSKPSLPLVATPLKMCARARSKGNDGDLGMSRRRPAIGKFEINYILEESCEIDIWINGYGYGFGEKARLILFVSKLNGDEKFKVIVSHRYKMIKFRVE